MGFFDNEKNVKEYIKMAEGYSGEGLIEILKQYLSPGSSVLELGMGPGKDLDILNRFYQTTGSDHSKIFVDLYLQNNPGAKVLLLDAVSLKTAYRFDGIYSNKVLIHLTKDQLATSIKRQKEILNKNGIIFHSFWKGNTREEYDGLIFQYYEVDELKALFKSQFDILQIQTYQEMEADDSIYIIAKN
ncbi:MAG: class I SAM-dependent methyltransferase [Spirochaetes bacterium]|nr:class I SAM-dependent methyltransferase [Spirochaetota bacterium]